MTSDIHGKATRALFALWKTAQQRDEIEWPRLIRFANSHGVLPLLSSAVLEERVTAPAAIRHGLRGWLQRHEHRCLRLTRTAVSVLRRLEKARIPAVGLKGPFLAERLYGSVALRQFCALDILVPQYELWRAAAALQELGYRPAVPELLASRASRAFQIRIDNHLAFARGQDVVELHWSLGPRYLRFKARHAWRALTIPSVRDWRALAFAECTVCRSPRARDAPSRDVER